MRMVTSNPASRALGPLWSGALVLVLAALLSPAEALAAATPAKTFGDVVCNLYLNGGPFGRILVIICYIIGAFFSVKSVLLLNQHFQNPSQPKVIPAIAHFFAAGAFLSVEVFAGILQRSIFGGGLSANGLQACKPGAVTPLSSSAGGLDLVMQNFVSNLHDPFFHFLSAICICLGLFLIVKGLQKASKIGTDPRAAATHAIIVNWVVGAALISVGSSLSAILQTLLGTDTIDKVSTFSGIDWGKVTGSTETTKAADNTVRAILGFVQILGGIAFVRGWLQLKKAVEGGGNATVPQGLTHIIGGAMAINIMTMAKVIDSTFGTGLIK